MPIRLIAIDIDGTLLDSTHRVPARNLQALDAAVAQGIEIAIVTGRRHDFARPVIETLRCPVTAITSNGALVRLPDGTSPMRRLLPSSAARAVLDGTRPWRDSAALVFDRPRAGQVVFERLDLSLPARRAYVRLNEPYIEVVAPLEEALTEDPLQIMFNGTVAQMRALFAAVAALPIAPFVSLAATEYEDRDFGLVDVLDAGWGKGAMLDAWRTRQGYARDEVMAIGDNLNDIDMLEAAGLPVVMGNAVPALLSRGWTVTGHCDDAGVAQAIERWALGMDWGSGIGGRKTRAGSAGLQPRG